MYIVFVLENYINFPKKIPQKLICLFPFRLAYHQRMVDIVPANFGPFIPEKPQPACKYEGEPAPGKFKL
jgi:hypothetical protein